MDRNQLLESAKRGDAEAFCKVYEEYKDRLFRYAYYRLGNMHDAEDAVSDCVMSAFRQIKDLKEPSAFDAWIFRILSGCVNRWIKSQINSRSQDSLDEIEQSRIMHSVNTVDSDPMEQVEMQTDLEKALEKLGSEEREIVLLSAVGGFSSGEIADMTGLRPGSVRSKLSRSLKKLRKDFES